MPPCFKSLSAERELMALGMSEFQIKEVARAHKAATEIEIRAPITGYVLARNVVRGMKFDRGTELFRIADISRVWVLADVFENEARYFIPGMKATVALPQGGKTFEARVSKVLPQFDPTSRTLKVRLEADNPANALRPDMFVDIELAVRIPPMITVPADAVVNTGLEKRVYLDLGEGHYLPRPVDTGSRFGDRVEITRGLAVGERVVISGNFLLDSESRLRAAASGPEHQTTAHDPVCGMDFNLRAGTARQERHGTTYYFCSDRCKDDFTKDPEKFASVTQPTSRKMDPRSVAQNNLK